MSNAVVEKALQQAVVDLIELSLRGKQMHWNIQGEDFRSLHLFLDEIIDAVRLDGDEAAERLITIGTAPDGRAETVAKTTSLEPVEAGILSTDKVYQQYEADLMTVSKNIQATLDEVDEADPLTGDLLIGICRNLEKNAWMLRSQGK
ncbi:MAG: DNA starvation/stationary phase protection protein [Actinomycetaceae bacterium]|nr:DNA starvation/stationary phase protection protein [Actinomycetaceae bacterium]MDU0970948.1 DNA starvation/stationary phase protection protein [Actinomycetaceae bacterium]